MENVLAKFEGYPAVIGIIIGSDNFSFQNNGIKKCTCWKTMVFLENNGFFKAMFWTRRHT